MDRQDTDQDIVRDNYARYLRLAGPSNRATHVVCLIEAGIAFTVITAVVSALLISPVGGALAAAFFAATLASYWSRNRDVRQQTIEQLRVRHGLFCFEVDDYFRSGTPSTGEPASAGCFQSAWRTLSSACVRSTSNTAEQDQPSTDTVRVSHNG